MSSHSSWAPRARIHLGPPGALAVREVRSSVTCSLGCSISAQPQPPGTMSRPSWSLPGTVHPNCITIWDTFPTAPLATQSFAAAAGLPSLPSSSPAAPSYFRATKLKCKKPSQQLQLPQFCTSEFPALRWKTPSSLPTSLFIAFHSPSACPASTVVRNISSAPVNHVPTAGTRAVSTEGQRALRSYQHQDPGTLGKRVQHTEPCIQPLPIFRALTGAPMGQPWAPPVPPWWAQPPA